MKVVNHSLCHDDGTPYPFVETNKNMDGTMVPDILLMQFTAVTATRSSETPQSLSRLKWGIPAGHFVWDRRRAITFL